MPIRPEMRGEYPADWKAISLRIRTVRAGGRCECDGRCGHPMCSSRTSADQRCRSLNGQANPVTGSKVVLTVAHLNHTPSDCRDENVLALCQQCHLATDTEHHAQTRAATRRAALAAVMDPLWEDAAA